MLEPGYAEDFSVPLLILHGDKDHVNDIHASEKFIDIVPIKDKKFIPVKGSLHSIFLERQEIYDEAEAHLLEWLSSH